MLLFFADDFSYYWFHRISHESRFFWASHVVHHSSTHYNLSTALRQTWVPMTYLPFWLWMPAIGFAPWMVLLAQAWSLIYQFWIHTERVRRLPRPLEAVLNTPSHHRVHHGSNEVYLDRNYGGILIIWDKLFGTYQPEGERVRYGLTKNIDTFNPVRAAFHEYVAMWHDIKRAAGLRDEARGPLPRPRLDAARRRVGRDGVEHPRLRTAAVRRPAGDRVGGEISAPTSASISTIAGGAAARAGLERRAQTRRIGGSGSISSIGTSGLGIISARSGTSVRPSRRRPARA